ncbi:MAG: FHA domain-containing protein [Oligosphaeraceae bacterium]|nr:FHA domain-containing protein [Oligosphaeraceae bacterium]
MAFFLKIVDTTGKDLVVQKLEPGETLVGRSRTATVRVDNAEVSGKHFVIRLAGETASVENLSTAGIIMDGRILYERAPLSPGQEIQIGSSLKCIFLSADEKEMEQFLTPVPAAAAVAPSPADVPPQSDTAGGEDTPVAGAAEGGSAAGTETGTGTDTGTATGTDTGTDTGSGTPNDSTGSKNTQVQKTRVATPEEILYIKHQRVAMRRRRTVLRVLIFLLLCGVLTWFWLQKSPPDERVLSWPKLENGKFSTKFAVLPGGGVANGSFNLYYPYWSNTQVKISEAEILINTFLGDTGAVPFNILLQRTVSLDFLNHDLQTAIQQWMTEVSQADESSWSFEGVWPLAFFGSDNGIPYLSVAYTRSQDEVPWAGIARIFRQAEARYVLRLEAPLNEKARAGHVMQNAQLLRFNPVFVSSHWEGGTKAVPCSWERIQSIQNALRQDSPGRLVDLELTIKGMLIQSRLNNDNVHYQLLMEQFQLLRLAQQRVYNLFKIKITNARLDQDQQRMAALLQDSLAVFSLSDDKRYHEIRNNRW